MVILGGPIWNKRIIDWDFTKKLIKNFYEVKKSQGKVTNENHIILQSKLKIESHLYSVLKVILFEKFIILIYLFRKCLFAM